MTLVLSVSISKKEAKFNVIYIVISRVNLA